MAFKINVSDKGKTAKFETENEELTEKSIGDKLSGAEISADLAGYELEITGTSDKAGFPGKSDAPGANLQEVLLTRGWGMHDSKKGIRLRKTIRGKQISLDTVQINLKVLKEGSKKFSEFLKKPAEPAEAPKAA